MVRSLTDDFKLVLDLGREPGTKQPQNWASTGARLGLSVVVRLRDTRLPEGMRTEFAVGGAESTFELVLLQPSTHIITSAGTREVSISGGGWSLSPIRGDTSGACWLRFWIEHSGAARNGVALSPGRLCCSIRVRQASDAQCMMSTRDELKRRMRAQREAATGGGALSSSRHAITTIGPPPILQRNDQRQCAAGYAALEQQLGRLQEADLQRLHAEARRRLALELASEAQEKRSDHGRVPDVLVERDGFIAIPRRWGFVFWDYPIVGKFRMTRI